MFPPSILPPFLRLLLLHTLSSSVSQTPSVFHTSRALASLTFFFLSLLFALHFFPFQYLSDLLAFPCFYFMFCSLFLLRSLSLPRFSSHLSPLFYTFVFPSCTPFTHSLPLTVFFLCFYTFRSYFFRVFQSRCFSSLLLPCPHFFSL